MAVMVMVLAGYGAEAIVALTHWAMSPLTASGGRP
jgi:hypothetical protein